MREKLKLAMPVIAVMCATVCALVYTLMGSQLVWVEDVPDNLQGLNLQTGTMALDPFENIEINVKSPDVRVERGDGYSVKYHLHSKEHLNCAEVRDDTLYFSTDVNLNLELGGQGWEIVVTVPEDAALDTLKISTLGGDICLADRAFNEGCFRSSAGQIALRNLDCDTLNLNAMSQGISVENSVVQAISADNGTGMILLDGEFGDATLSTISGNCLVKGAVTENATIKTVSGNLMTELPGASVSAESYGKIRVDGAMQGQRQINFMQDGPRVGLKSLSGCIDVYTFAIS